MSTGSLYRSSEGERAVMALYAKVLARWPVPYQALSVETRHGTTSVIASGPATAPALILLHGACSNALAWIGDVTEYSRYYRVYAVDAIGEPGGSAPNRPPWDGPAYAEWMHDVLEGLRVQRGSLIGISQGGWMALKFATAEPERVVRLVLLAPGGVTPVRLSFMLRAIPLSMLGRRGAEAVNRITFGSQPIDEQAVAFMNAIMTHFKPRTDGGQMLTDEELGRLTMPVLLVAGAQDALYASEKTVARLRQVLPDLKVDFRPEAGHVLHNLAPTILPFLTAELAGEAQA